MRAVMRAVPGLRRAKLPSPALLASAVSLTVHATGAPAPSAPESSTTTAVRRTTSPSNALSASGTILTVAGPDGSGAAASLHAIIPTAANRANAARATAFAGATRIDEDEIISVGKRGTQGHPAQRAKTLAHRRGARGAPSVQERIQWRAA